MAVYKNFEFPIVSVNKEEYDAMQNWIASHKAFLTEKKLYIFGAGIRGCMMLKLLEEAQVKVAGFCDSSCEKQDGFIKEYRIFNPLCVFDNPEEKYFLVSPENTADIERVLQKKGYKEEKNYSVVKSRTYSSYQREFFRGGDIDYLLFGDCYFTELDIDELFDQSMGELAADKLGREKTKILSLHGMCVPSFYHLMKMQLELGIIPKAVAFIINIPFCNGIQTKLPQSQHAGLLRQIQGNADVHNDEFDQYVELAEKRSRNINAKSFSTKVNSNNKDENYIEKLLTKSRYMYAFQEDNENVEYMKKMIELLQANHIKTVPFFPALNFYVGIEYFGQEFINRYSAICDNIKKCVSHYGIEILDMSFALEKEYFVGSRMTKFPNRKGKEKEINLLCDRVRD